MRRAGPPDAAAAEALVMLHPAPDEAALAPVVHRVVARSGLGVVLATPRLADAAQLASRAAGAGGRAVVHVDPADEVSVVLMARVLRSIAAGAAVWTPEAARHHAGARFAGWLRLPGLAARVRLYRVEGEGLQTSTPPLQAPSTGGVLRKPDLEAFDELLGFGLRVLCVRGESGVGVSHLLGRFVERRRERGERPLVLDLRGGHPAVLVALLARQLDLPALVGRADDEVIASLAAGLDASERPLVVLDHVVPAVRPLVRQLVARTRLMWVLGGTGPLGVAAEVTYEVHPLRPCVDGAEGAAELLAGFAGPAVGEDTACAVAEALDAGPLTLRVAAAALRHVHPLALFEWASVHRRSFDDVVAYALAAMPEVDRAQLSALAAWPGLIGTSQPPDASTEALVAAGWLVAGDDPFLPGLRRVAMHPRVRQAILEHAPGSPDDAQAVHTALVARAERWLAGLSTRRAPAVQPLIHAWMPTLDQTLAGLLEHPVSTAELTIAAPLLDLRVAHGRWLGSVDDLMPLLERALQAVGARFDIDPLVVVRLFRARGHAFAQRGEWERAAADFERALPIARRRESVDDLRELRVALVAVAIENQRFDVASRHIEEAERLCGDGERPARLWMLRGRLDAALGRLESALGAYTRASGAASEVEPDLAGEIALERAVLCRRLGRRGDARLAYLQALDRWAVAGRPGAVARIRFQLATLLQEVGELDEAERLLLDVERRAARAGDDARRGLVAAQIALIHLERGDLPRAQASFVTALSASRLGGDRAGQGMAQGFIALAHHLAGRHNKAREAYRAALRDLESGSDRRFGALFHSLLGAVEAELGNVADARILIDMARLRLPDADPAMREAVAVFQRVLDYAAAVSAAREGDEERARELFAGVHETLVSLEARVDNIYLRFAKRYLRELVREPA